MNKVTVTATTCFGPDDDYFIDLVAELKKYYDVDLVGTNDPRQIEVMEVDCRLTGDLDDVVNALCNVWNYDDFGTLRIVDTMLQFVDDNGTAVYQFDIVAAN